MSDTVSIADIKALTSTLSPWAHIATVDDVETKRRLWDGVLDDDILEINVERALLLEQYGMGGVQRWSA